MGRTWQPQIAPGERCRKRHPAPQYPRSIWLRCLNRLTSWVSSGELVANETANFNGIDNITDKTGIGTYQYGTTCGASTNAGPHALCKAGTTTYNYDKNGNMLNDSAGRVMAYTTYDMPSEITKAGHKTAFSYGPSRARYKRVDTEGSQTTTTLYLGSVEKVYYPDGTIQWKRNIAGVGLITQTVNSSGAKLSEAQRYLIKDHLGSLSLITDEIGAVEQSNYFDPWGKERKIVTSGSIKQWAADTTSFVLNNKPITTRGFTGHEQLAEVGLVHMNGRIYDGALGRFVQADPIIQDPMRVQSLNRYSYVWNNPLNATDPSGFFGNCVSHTEHSNPRGCNDQPDQPIKKDDGQQPSNGGNSNNKVRELDRNGCYINTCFFGVLPTGFLPNGASKNSSSNTAANSTNTNQGAQTSTGKATVNNQSADTSSALKETKGSIFRIIVFTLASAFSDPNQLQGDILADAFGGKSPTSSFNEIVTQESEVVDKKFNGNAAAGSIDKVTLAVIATATTVAAVAEYRKSKAPRNSHLANGDHPKTGVPFDKNGYPDFSRYSIAEVKIKQTGNRGGDDRAANKAAGFKTTPEGYTWHHHQDGTTMQLVPLDLHAKTGHTGGYTGN